jgi:hypothetical protein
MHAYIMDADIKQLSELPGKLRRDAPAPSVDADGTEVLVDVYSASLNLCVRCTGLRLPPLTNPQQLRPAAGARQVPDQEALPLHPRHRDRRRHLGQLADPRWLQLGAGQDARLWQRQWQLCRA